jgi:phosphopantothenoylcysteine decarboxylase/phosphopantothenate--cysteine ligase
VLVGFAAETADVVARAEVKLRRKGLDLVVANDVSAPGTGFDHETNAVSILGADGAVVDVPLAEKRAVAAAVVDEIVARLARASLSPL